ncbi:hypothetical protein B8W66_14895 [Mycobacterium decipiens]|uniref:Uncharacterized protein n=1 Tax=Mycobacterium decipiens TaxID=1430326 RepID=A0A1X2LT63_9MYCO|nr:hypothetical protein B8W66_14895 [Mycobacterium decipiens]
MASCREVRAVPSLTAWRDGLVGDMATAFNFAVPPGHPVLNPLPKLPQYVPNALLGDIVNSYSSPFPYRVPFPRSMRTQETAPARGIPSGPC